VNGDVMVDPTGRLVIALGRCNALGAGVAVDT
jgi:hypothetical protein